jgi:hypothetical protein
LSAPRLPAHLEVAGLIRAVEVAGGFAAVLKKGEPDGGTILAVLTQNGTATRLYERMPSASGARSWTLSRAENTENKQEFSEYLDRRTNQDPDLWIVELDIADGERFIGLTSM